MSNYRRLYVPGGTYFFTLVSYRRQAIFADEQRVILLRQAFREVKNKRPFELLAAVVLPDHLHCLWTLPYGDADFSTRWQMVKTAFSRRVPSEVKANGSKMLWQPRFYEHCLRGDNDFHKHMDYIHYNPVKHGLATKPGEWPYGSFRRFVNLGLYTSNWGEMSPSDVDDLFHEYRFDRDAALFSAYKT
ncbi:MAG: transposase [Methylicorpusculum sp.]|uniref:REP-associated tyrosine transposase n=1 Tax=Methylicorpusculum sp. TaxID=2713644 RepID=UPI002722BC63|nr:transposase [Methylicorpusculum sp.]MDO8938047.1 transposase [Methylicorpusculum sp.]MDP2201027.1 transposase [Methylicorpusculum sp.]